jgi:hypothetical protein
MHAGRSKWPKNYGVAISLEDQTNPFIYYIKTYFSSKRPSRKADGNTIMILPCHTKAFCQFLLRRSPSSSKISMALNKVSKARHCLGGNFRGPML